MSLPKEYCLSRGSSQGASPQPCPFPSIASAVSSPREHHLSRAPSQRILPQPCLFPRSVASAVPLPKHCLSHVFSQGASPQPCPFPRSGDRCIPLRHTGPGAVVYGKGVLPNPPCSVPFMWCLGYGFILIFFLFYFPPHTHTLFLAS